MTTAPTTIVSLIASATEIICALDLGDRLVGRSHECDFPTEVLALPTLSAPRVDPEGSSGAIDRDVRRLVREGLSVYRVDVETLQRLRPDLIVTQDHCEVCAVSLRDVEDALCALDLPDTRVCTLHPECLADVRQDFQAVANAAGVPDAGQRLVAEFSRRLETLANRTAPLAHPRIALIEWLDPPMIAGGWMPELAAVAGTRPVIVEGPETFHTVDWETIVAANPDLVVVLPCGFDLERTRAAVDAPPIREALARIPAVAGDAGTWSTETPMPTDPALVSPIPPNCSRRLPTPS